ncbi:MAG: RidA family protein [Acidothermaceae bacterium]
MAIERYQVEGAPTPAGPYSHAVAAHGFLYTAGFGPVDPATGERVGTDVAAQTRQVLRNVGTVLAAVGLGFGDVVKSTVHLANVERDFGDFNAAYAEFFSAGYPVRTTVGSTLPGILVEIDVVAAFPEAR